MKKNEHWVGTWTTTPVPTEGISFDNQTLRMIAHVSIGGSKVRVRISNLCGKEKLKIGEARIALHDAYGGIVGSTDQPLTFNGEPSAVIAVGALVLSDPVAMDLQPFSDVAVSIYLPDKVPEEFKITGHGNCHQTNYVSNPGNFTSAVSMPLLRTTETWYFLSAIEVVAPATAAGAVILGDSLGDCNLSTLDANMRWSDQLARRLHARGGRVVGVMNQGCGGARILHDIRGESALRRFDRDVLSQPGVTHVFVLLGINDIRNRHARASEVVTAEELIGGLKQLVARAHARGLYIFGCTVLPFENETFLPGAYTLEREKTRQTLNDWIRSYDDFDAVVDFDKVLRDPNNPRSMLPLYDCGDHLHPGDRGYEEMGNCIDLSLFDAD